MTRARARWLGNQSGSSRCIGTGRSDCEGIAAYLVLAGLVADVLAHWNGEEGFVRMLVVIVWGWGLNRMVSKRLICKFAGIGV